jgi:hypothetical protein
VTRLPLVALGILAIRLAVLAAMLPAWQQPDEHVHVAVAEMWRAHFLGSTDPDPAREAEILESMAANGWWRHYTGGEPPSPLPSLFSHTGNVSDTMGVTPSRDAYPVLYYGGIGAALSKRSQHPVTTDMSTMRAVSAVLSMITLWVAWIAARAALGVASGGVVALLLALHPQFALAATAASPDAAVNLCGATVCCLAVFVLRRRRVAINVVAMWLVVGVAVNVDRSGLPLAAIAAIVTGIAVLRPLGRAGAALGAGLIAAALAAVWLVPALSMHAAALWLVAAPVPRARSLDYFSQFHQMFFTTWWFAAGWLRYRAPAWWLVIPVALAMLTAIGVTRRLVTDAARRLMLTAAAIALLVQTAAVYWAYYRPGIGPQGRYLFPMMVPALCLLVLGIEGVVPVAWRPRALVALVVLFALLDTSVWEVVILPAYAY